MSACVGVPDGVCVLVPGAAPGREMWVFWTPSTGERVAEQETQWATVPLLPSGVPFGYAVLSPGVECWQIDTLWIEEPYRRHGNGTVALRRWRDRYGSVRADHDISPALRSLLDHGA